MPDHQPHELLIRYLSSTHERLLRYVFVLLPDWDSAQEVVQNAHVVVWKKADEFQTGGEEEFFRWAKQIAYFEVKKLVEKQRRRPLLFDGPLTALIHDEVDAMSSDLELQREALATCIDKLPPRDQELVRLKYWKMSTVASLSEQLGRSADALYKSLQRIRRQLLGCIEREARRLG
ncbi:sigma-70 family RNA polymerase sigma factor [Pirellulales bacterium]|nr:sigma-70 family RNA polymerase sigma factor [Pirellulales bacterium]